MKFLKMESTFLVITSIAGDDAKALKQFAIKSNENNVSFIVIGDKKSPKKFDLNGCDYYSVERQNKLDYSIMKHLPFNHYSRKNLGYLLAIDKGAEIIIETDDDNFPMKEFWMKREKNVSAHLILNEGWVNSYKHFTNERIWPRGFALERIHDKFPKLDSQMEILSPIHQGLADKNPDVDAIYRLTHSLPIFFLQETNIALGENSFCPFNSQNTTWFKEAFYLLYLPSYCSFRMTDIWRSYIAQRIAWTCGWPILFHKSSVWQERNEHNLMIDFQDEIIGYKNADLIYQELIKLDLKKGVNNISENMILCYQLMIDLELIGIAEMDLLKSWLNDVNIMLSKK